MKGQSRKTVLVIAGMPGAGKSLASEVAITLRLPAFISGDIIRHEARIRGLKPNKRNLGQLMLDLREREGMGAVARRLIPLLAASNQDFIVYEGARNLEEIEELAKHYRVVCVAIHASPLSRYSRLLKRKRSDRPRSWKDFLERDERELKVGVGKVIALADRTVENEDTKQDFKRRVKRLLISFLKNSGSGSSQRQRSTRQRTKTK